jgi:hypothetical protein
MAELVQFDRHASVNVIPAVGPGLFVNPPAPAGIGLSGAPELRVVFEVEKSTSHEPNRAVVQIWNLGEVERRQADGSIKPIAGDPGLGPVIDRRVPLTASVQLFAGYQGGLGQIFRGDGASVEHEHPDVDWITTLRAGDGLWPLSQAVANRNFDMGTPAVEVLSYLAGVMGLALGMTQPIAALAGYILQGPLVCMGRARDALEQLLGALPVEWWVDDGVLVVLPLVDSVQAELGLASSVSALPLPLVIVSAEQVPGAARLLEQPRRLEDGGASVSMLLFPEMRPGRQVSIAGQTELFGLYRAERIRHRGDNRGGDFVTECELRPMATV